MHIHIGVSCHWYRTAKGSLFIPQEARQLLANLSLGSTDMQPPGMLHYLPHLIGHPEGLVPAHRLAQGRTGGELHVTQGCYTSHRGELHVT